MTTSATVTTGQAAPRSAFSLTSGEGLMAFVVAAGAWLLVFGSGAIESDNSVRFSATPLPVWLPFGYCNALGISYLCARRFLRREETLDVSRLGYAALAFPILETLIIAVHIIFGTLLPALQNRWEIRLCYRFCS